MYPPSLLGVTISIVPQLPSIVFLAISAMAFSTVLARTSGLIAMSTEPDPNPDKRDDTSQ